MGGIPKVRTSSRAELFTLECSETNSPAQKWLEVHQTYACLTSKGLKRCGRLQSRSNVRPDRRLRESVFHPTLRIRTRGSRQCSLTKLPSASVDDSPLLCATREHGFGRNVSELTPPPQSETLPHL